MQDVWGNEFLPGGAEAVQYTIQVGAEVQGWLFPLLDPKFFALDPIILSSFNAPL